MVQSDPLHVSSKQHVTIVGGGIKGLFAARQLAKLGYQVTILERSQHAGGKIKTVRSRETITTDHNNNAISACPALVEMGPMRILETQKNTLKLLEELELDVIPYIEDNGNAPFFINGKRCKVDNLNIGVLIDAGLISSDVLKTKSSLNRETSFTEVLTRSFKNIDEVLTQTIGSNKIDGQISVAEFLDIPGKDSELRKCAKVILDLRNGENGNHHFEAVDEFSNILKLHSGNPLSVKGGFDQIVSRLIEQLTHCDILYDSEVIEIKHHGEQEVQVMFKTESNQIKTLKSDGVIIACPAGQNIRFFPNLPTQHLKIFDQLKASCIPALKCVLHFKQRFWEKKEHGNVFGGTCWISPSDTNQIILPSSESSDGSGYLMIYLRGDPVRRWLNCSKEVRIEKALSDVERLFPTAQNCIRDLFLALKEQPWDKEGEGAYVLQHAKAFRDKLITFGRIVFSPVPRPWIDDTLIDSQIAVDNLHKLFISKPNPNVSKKSHIDEFLGYHELLDINTGA